MDKCAPRNQLIAKGNLPPDRPPAHCHSSLLPPLLPLPSWQVINLIKLKIYSWTRCCNKQIASTEEYIIEAHLLRDGFAYYCSHSLPGLYILLLSTVLQKIVHVCMQEQVSVPKTKSHQPSCCFPHR